eukprot:4290223-Pyramimonas_sp.AAC.1
MVLSSQPANKTSPLAWTAIRSESPFVAIQACRAKYLFLCQPHTVVAPAGFSMPLRCLTVWPPTPPIR